jgi:drug/metabolite transporter (DMT)-like permease
MERSQSIAMASLIGAIVLWSASLSVVSIAVDGASPGSVTFWRCAVGAVVLGLWVVVNRRRSKLELPRASRSDWAWIAASGASCGIAFLLIAHGMQQIGSGPAGIILSSIPGLTILLVAMEHAGAGIQRRHVLSLVIGGCGALLLSLPSGGHWSLIGIVVLGLAAMSQAVTNVASAHALARIDPIAVAAASIGFAALVSLPAADFGVLPTRSAMLAIIVLGLLPTGLAYVMFFNGVQKLGATTAGFSNFLVPPVAVVAGLVLLGEIPDARTMAALVLAMAALAIGMGGSALVERQDDLAASMPGSDLVQRA